jgi:hypothetical protein
MSWTWRLEGSGGAQLDAPAVVTAVSLLEDDRVE